MFKLKLTSHYFYQFYIFSVSKCQFIFFQVKCIRKFETQFPNYFFLPYLTFLFKIIVLNWCCPDSGLNSVSQCNQLRIWKNFYGEAQHSCFRDVRNRFQLAAKASINLSLLHQLNDVNSNCSKGSRIKFIFYTIFLLKLFAIIFI